MKKKKIEIRKTPSESSAPWDGIIRFIDARYKLVSVAILMVVTLVVYANSLNNEFTNWDDRSLIVKNQDIRSLRTDHLMRVFKPQIGSTYQPLRVFSYAIDYHFWGLNPVGYHLQNIFWHGISGVLLFYALCLAIPMVWKDMVPGGKGIESLFDQRFAAFFASFLFLVHPVQVEAVSWLSSRKYVLLIFFSMLCFYLFIKSSENETYHPVSAIFSFVSYILAVMSSPFGVVVPGLVFLFDYCRDASMNPFGVIKRRLPYYLPFFILFFIAAAVLWRALIGSDTGGASKGHFMGNPVFTGLTILRVLFDYMRNYVFPIWLNNRYVDYISVSFFELKVMIGFSGLVLVIIFIARQLKSGKKEGLFCAGWFLIAWLPASNIIPISTKMADRYVYLASIGPFLYLSILLSRGIAGSMDRKKMQHGLLGMVVFLMGAFSILSIQRNNVWQNSITLWRDSIKKDDMNHVAFNNLGLALDHADRFEAAVENLKRSLTLDPEYEKAYINLGNAYYRRQYYREAIACYKKVVSLGKSFSHLLYLNYANALRELGHIDDAIVYFKKLPRDAKALNNLGNISIKKGQLEAAKDYYLRALSIAPGLIEANNNLGNILASFGKFDDAIAHYEAVLKKDDNLFDPHLNIGRLYAIKGRREKAKHHFLKAIAINPDQPDALTNLGNLFAFEGNIEAAVTQYKKALAKDPNHEEANRNMKRINAFLKQDKTNGEGITNE